MVDIDPMDAVESEDDDSPADKRKQKLNSAVAIAVAILATFMGICKVKDDNIVQAMQQAQAAKIDDWSFYQARNVRQDIAQSAAAQLAAAHAADSVVARFQALAREQAGKKDSLRVAAQHDQTAYDSLNYRDAQFDLSDTLVALAISMLALTSLTHKRWLYWIAMVPTGLGVLMGLAGLLGWHIHPDAISSLLS
jgi:hypothetical protein